MATPLTRLLPELRRLAAPPESDADLLGRFVQRRDETAFARLVERHRPMVLHLCRRVLGDADAAEDACQATFLVLARKATAIGRPALLAGWLYRVAQRVARKAPCCEWPLARGTPPCGAATGGRRPAGGIDRARAARRARGGVGAAAGNVPPGRGVLLPGRSHAGRGRFAARLHGGGAAWPAGARPGVPASAADATRAFAGGRARRGGDGARHHDRRSRCGHGKGRAGVCGCSGGDCPCLDRGGAACDGRVARLGRHAPRSPRWSWPSPWAWPPWVSERSRHRRPRCRPHRRPQRHSQHARSRAPTRRGMPCRRAP